MKNHFSKMFKLLVFSLFCIYGSYINLIVTATYVSVLNTLVQQPGWRQFTTPVNTFTYKEENFYDRIWQLHLVLGVYYAIDLIVPIQLSLYFWDFCQKNCNDDLKNICIQSLAKSYQIFYEEISRMQKSLFYFFTIIQLPIEIVKDALFNRVHFIFSFLSELETIKGPTTPNSSEKTLEIALVAIRSAFEFHTQKVQYYCIENPPISLLKILSKNNIPMEEQLIQIQEVYDSNINKLIQINNTYGIEYDLNTLAKINNLIQLYGR
ncbi:uncharacterized protein LOC126904160 [Daktulosphaira vitifoliae]|uniref:uncharacterized protein LOC126904160 n=1 Tax=Daktulosphaira vitifoliae TaxID=58002 RepID=UPI0021A9958B|nr:uncharacterized protein LOC126904160 [Daktulosphaira vitifoliae]